MTIEMPHAPNTDLPGYDGAVDALNTDSPNTDDARPHGAAGDVWDALIANPGATVTAIADAAEVSRATVARALTNLESGGLAVRTRGGWDEGKRVADTWRAIRPDVETDDGDGEAPSGETPVAVPEEAATERDAPEPDDEGLDEAAAIEAREVLLSLGVSIAAAVEALRNGDGAAALAAAETAYSGSGKARRLVRAVVNGRPRSASGRPRSQPGEMRAKVAKHLEAYPASEFTPHEVSKVLGHSAGAIANALDRLVDTGEAQLVCERPRRYAAANSDPY